MEILGVNYGLDLSFSMGDVIMLVIAILAFRVNHKLGEIDKMRFNVDKDRAVMKANLFVYKITKCVKLGLPIEKELAKSIHSDAPELIHYCPKKSLGKMKEFLVLSGAYIDLLIKNKVEDIDDFDEQLQKIKTLIIPRGEELEKLLK